jgi:hypothetical protein
MKENNELEEIWKEVELYGFQQSIIKQNAAESHLKSLRPIY